jgi:hypothetical protein
MNTLAILEYGHQTVLKTLDGVTRKHWGTPGVCGYWSIKEIVAHLASYEQLHTDVLHSLLNDGENTPTLDLMLASHEQFNDLEVPRRSASSPEGVLAEYNRIHGELMELADRFPEEQFSVNGILPWYGEEYCLNDFLVFSSYGHKREHSAQVNVFRDSLE